ncbi:MAG: 3-phosphoshikimate 1-carboxyvinyltransferase [Saprospiraceae bacterium]|nr:3-phosphoshikimate 1-carboxyvinyltransferase [Saprospiraceae bacterium]
MNLNGEIILNGSKSISNRILIIQALSGIPFDITGLSNAKDTETLKCLLDNIDAPTLDAGEAGTVYRFMTAFLAWRGKDQLLVGNKRMCERPIGVLVDALNDLGANIHYMDRVGYPPLKMKKNDTNRWGNQVIMGANVSSQFVSALLMLAPILPNGLELKLKGKVISKPYIQMTLNLMQEFGVASKWEDNLIKVSKQKYSSKVFYIEADWSAASYFYSLVSLSKNAEIQLIGLSKNSIQGDAAIVNIMKHFGVTTTFNNKGILLKKIEKKIAPFVYDFSDCPDIAQTLAVICAALNVKAKLTGLETLTIKETDRISALKTELDKLGCNTLSTPNSLSINMGIQNKFQSPKIKTYNDHRMAMSFAPLVLILNNILIENKEVVNKSYPEFWKDLQSLGINFN